MIRLLAGDCRDVLATLPAESVQCVVTSPPYYGLRDYGTALWDGGDAACDHRSARTGGAARAAADAQRAAERGYVPSSNFANYGAGWTDGSVYRDTCGKCGAVRVDRQIGLEATPDEYLATMVGVFREVRRVLRTDGTVWCNLGDSYASAPSGSFDKGGRGSGALEGGGYRSNKARSTIGHGAKPKDLLLMPARLALALQADGWWVRSDIIWHKPNPMPESVTDRPTSAHEHVFMLTRSARYFYDSAAIVEPGEMTPQNRYTNGKGAKAEGYAAHRQPTGMTECVSRNARNVWTIATHAYPDAHFATFPPELAERCIKAGTSERGCCAACGKPWVRETEKTPVGDWRSSDRSADLHDGAKGGPGGVMPGWEPARTTGWSSGCDHDAPTVPCTVLDPFAGAGTTLLVADRLQRDAIGIELNTAYTEMAMERCRADAPLFTSFPPAEPPEDERMGDLFSGDEYDRPKSLTTPRNDGNRWNENNGRGFMPRQAPDMAAD